MHTHIVHAHPEPWSYNGSLTRTAERALLDDGASVTISDLYLACFDPVERGSHYTERVQTDQFVPLAEQRHAWKAKTLPDQVVDEIHRLERADIVILQFPLWWHGPPAILKGWMDRVFVNGGLYTSRMRYGTGYFRGRRVVVSVTTGAPRAAFGPGSRGGDFETMLWPIHYSMHYMGFTVLPPFVSYGVAGHGYSYEDQSSLEARLQENLEAWAAHLKNLHEAEPLKFPDWPDWDEEGAVLALPNTRFV